MKPARLSDEKIKEIFLCHFTKQYGEEAAKQLLDGLPDCNYAKAIAQAALDDCWEKAKKEFAEWGIEICHEHLPKWKGRVDLMGGVLSRRECPLCWQSLEQG